MVSFYEPEVDLSRLSRCLLASSVCDELSYQREERCRFQIGGGVGTGSGVHTSTRIKERKDGAVSVVCQS